MKLDARELVSQDIGHAHGARYSCGLGAGQSEKTVDAAVSAAELQRFRNQHRKRVLGQR